MFLLVPAYPGCPGSKAVKRSLYVGGQGEERWGVDVEGGKRQGRKKWEKGKCKEAKVK